LGQMVLRGLVEPVGETFAGQTEQNPTRLMFEAKLCSHAATSMRSSSAPRSGSPS
jgi:hypothetical protein